MIRCSSNYILMGGGRGEEGEEEVEEKEGKGCELCEGGRREMGKMWAI